jgi:hypothetical protein
VQACNEAVIRTKYILAVQWSWFEIFLILEFLPDLPGDLHVLCPRESAMITSLSHYKENASSATLPYSITQRSQIVLANGAH